MINILLFGPPGAGKGTQAEYIVERYGLTEVSTGEIIRAEIAAGSELGKTVAAQMVGGGLASDEIVIEIIRNYIKNSTNTNGNIFDGFPRTQKQAEALHEILKSVNSGVTALISLEVPKEELIRRMKERGKISGRADDKSEEVMNNRIAVYEEKTKVVKEYYKRYNKCFEIDGSAPVESIAIKIRAIIDALTK